jgi:hypothetical protein
MKPALIHALAALCFCLAAITSTTPSAADDNDVLASYVARLSANDHLNSRGGKLTTVQQVLHQDRANYHRFGKADPEDESDPLFTTPDDRGYFETLNSSLSEAARRRIVNGTPLVRVTVFRSGAVNLDFLSN